MKDTGLHSIALFKHLSPARFHALFEVAELHSVRKRQALFRQGHPADAVWVVRSGWVHLVRVPEGDDESRAVVLFTVTPKDVLCGISVVEPGAYTASGVAGTEVTATRIPAVPFLNALMTEPAFAYDVLQLYALRIRHMAERYGLMAQPVPQRLAQTILRLRQQFGDTLPVTHRELAQMAWTTTESAIRVVRQFKRRGYVQGSRGRLMVTRPARLAHLLPVADGR